MDGRLFIVIVIPISGTVGAAVSFSYEVCCNP